MLWMGLETTDFNVQYGTLRLSQVNQTTIRLIADRTLTSLSRGCSGLAWASTHHRGSHVSASVCAAAGMRQLANVLS